MICPRLQAGPWQDWEQTARPQRPAGHPPVISDVQLLFICPHFCQCSLGKSKPEHNLRLLEAEKGNWPKTCQVITSKEKSYGAWIGAGPQGTRWTVGHFSLVPVFHSLGFWFEVSVEMAIDLNQRLWYKLLSPSPLPAFHSICRVLPWEWWLIDLRPFFLNLELFGNGQVLNDNLYFLGEVIMLMWITVWEFYFK